MLLTLTLSLLPQFTGTPQQVAPYGLPHSGPVAPQSQGQGNPAVVETFEAYTVAIGFAENIGSLFLDETTITGTGQGPGLTLGDCFYSCAAGSLQWNGDTYSGLPTKTFLANSGDSTLSVGYTSPQSSVTFGLHTFSGFPDVATVVAYDASGTIVDTETVSVPGPGSVPVNLTGTGILRVEIIGTYPWSPIIDDHDYDGGSGGTLQLSISGPCPGVNAVTINGGTPGAPCKIGYAFGTGSYVIPAGPCAGTVTGLDASATALPTTYFFDAAGQINFNQFIPAAACGAVFVQALEVGTCNLSNVVAL